MTADNSANSRLPSTAVGRVRPVAPDESGRPGTTWQTVRDEILTRIRSREWEPGTLIPTEKQLAADWGCARATVNRALRDLASAGIVERRRKVGTRVAKAQSLQTSRETSELRNEIRSTGATYGYRLLQSEPQRASAMVARQLHLREGDPVHYVSAVFFADDDAYCCQSVWLNTAVLPALDGAALADSSADEWLEHAANPNRSRVAILSHPLERRCADAMDLPVGSSVLTVEKTDWSDSTPLAFTRRFFPPKHRLVYED